jgi:asparagine synthase (glutamine-hydrolysing)
MRGFFGILNINNGDFKSAKEKYELGKADFDKKPTLQNNTIFIDDFATLVPLEIFESDLNYVGWSRLDNINELQNLLNLNSNAQEQEVILAAYQKWGVDSVKHLIGDFSFVIWDDSTKTLFLAKDQMGIRPLFYIEQNGLLYFGSTISAIKSALLEHPMLNETYIAKELCNYQQHLEDTFYKDIKRLKPAHCISIATGKTIEEIRYWELSAIDLSHCKNKEDYYELLRNALKTAIQSRIRGKSTVGCQLSGGMDSSAIAVLLSRLMDKNQLHTYSFVLDDKTRSYSDSGIDEQGTQEEIISYASLIKENHHHVTSFHYKDVFEELNTRNKVMGGLANSDAVWQDSMYKKASNENQVQVMFSGFPGDEGVSQNGNNYFYDYLNYFNAKGLYQHLLDFRLNGIKDFINYYRSKIAKTTHLYYSKVQKQRNLLNPNSKFNSKLIDTTFPFHPSFKGWQKQQICRPHTTLRAESEGSYANQYDIETVYPLADIRLLEIVYSLPAELFKPKPYSRALFRNLAIGILPDKVRLQPKSSGAKTLAFADYWMRTKANELKNYSLINHTGLLISEEEYLKKEHESELMKTKRLNTLKEIDYLIDLNLPAS